MQPRYKVLLAVSVALLLISFFPVCADASPQEPTGLFGYDSLDRDQQAAYDRFELGVDNKTPIILMIDKGVSVGEMQAITYAYMTDHPDKFWASYYSEYIYLEGSGLVTSVVSTVQNIKALDTDSMSKEIEKAVSSFQISGESMGDRVKSIHDFIVGRASYESDTGKYPDCGNIYGAFVQGKCKCDGFSLAMDYLCHKNGIKDIAVEIGEIKDGGDGHAWNIIKMDDGKWYYLDVTWDDGSAYIHRYDYFLIGSDTNTPTGSIGSTRTIFYDYHVTVSKDKYDYDAYGNDHRMFVFFAIALVVIIILVALLFHYFRKRKNLQSISP